MGMSTHYHRKIWSSYKKLNGRCQIFVESPARHDSHCVCRLQIVELYDYMNPQVRLSAWHSTVTIGWLYVAAPTTIIFHGGGATQVLTKGVSHFMGSEQLLWLSALWKSVAAPAMAIGRRTHKVAPFWKCLPWVKLIASPCFDQVVSDPVIITPSLASVQSQTNADQECGGFWAHCEITFIHTHTKYNKKCSPWIKCTFLR